MANSSQLLCRGGNVSPRSGSFQSCEEKTEWLKLLSPGAWHESVVQENIEVGLLCLRLSLLALNRPCSVFQCCLFLNIGFCSIDPIAVHCSFQHADPLHQKAGIPGMRLEYSTGRSTRQGFILPSMHRRTR